MPLEGCFTQQDPIGLAGGLNLYGFAQGDPVNFSDPFGLDPCRASRAWTECFAQGLANWGARQGGTLGSIALNTGAAANAALEASGINGAAAAGDRIGSGEILVGSAQAVLEVGGGEAAGAAFRALRGPALINAVVEGVQRLGARVKPHATRGGRGVAINFGDGTTVDVRVETHDPYGLHGNVQRWENGAQVQNSHVPAKK